MEHGLKQCLLDKNKHIKKDIAIKFETLCSSVNKDISEDNKENVHDFLWSAANPFTKIIYRTKKTHSLLKPLQGNKDIVLLSGN